MALLYLAAVWVHIITVCLWIGAMFFGDPKSERFFSRLFERKLSGIGWHAQAVLWITGLFMLYYRGITVGRLFSAEFVATSWGRLLWLKIGLALLLVVFQIIVGHKPSKLLYGYILVAFAAVGVGVLLVRPIAFLQAAEKDSYASLRSIASLQRTAPSTPSLVDFSRASPLRSF